MASNNRKLSNLFKGDKGIWMIFFFLCLISIIEVYSASSQLTYKAGNFMAPMIKHVVLLGMGIVAMILTLNIPCRYFKVMTLPLFVLSVVLLMIVFFIGQSTNGAQRWIPLCGQQFQPSELAKGALVLATAQILSAMQTDHGADRLAIKYIFIMCLPIIPLIVLENFSTAALLSIVIFLMMLIGRVPWSQLGRLLGVVIILGAIGVAVVMAFGTDPKEAAEGKTLTEQVAKDGGSVAKGGVLHRLDTWKGRIDRFLDKRPVAPADVDLKDKGAQPAHANIAIATSNVVGKGPGNSEERDFLSQAYSDFIYAIVIEEMGIEGAFVVALLYVFLLFRTGRIAGRCENNFPAFLAMGLALMLVTQALFNMCVAVGLAPVTGQPLPLISKGGTSTIINCVYIGAILSISRSAKKKTQPAGTPPGDPVPAVA